MLYMASVLPQLTGYGLLQFSWKYEEVYWGERYPYEMEMSKEFFNNRTKKVRKLIEELMASADDSVYACDSKDHVERGTYERVNNFAQGIIQKNHVFDKASIGLGCDGIVKDCYTIPSPWNGIKVCYSVSVLHNH